MALRKNKGMLKKKTAKKKSPAKKPAGRKKAVPAAGKKSPGATAKRKKPAVIKNPAPAAGKEKEPARAELTAQKAGLEQPMENIRKDLLARRQHLVAEAKVEIEKYIKGENRQLVETALDDGDWSVVDLSEDVNLRRLSSHREMIGKIDEALRKMDEGTYGICEDCGEEINPERLRVLPFAIYCREDQEKRELMEAIEKEQGI